MLEKKEKKKRFFSTCSMRWIKLGRHFHNHLDKFLLKFFDVFQLRNKQLCKKKLNFHLNPRRNGWFYRTKPFEIFKIRFKLLRYHPAYLIIFFPELFKVFSIELSKKKLFFNEKYAWYFWEKIGLVWFFYVLINKKIKKRL